MRPSTAAATRKATTTPRIRAAIPFALVVVLAVAAHARSFGAAFVYDDATVVAADERLGDPSRWAELLTSSYWGDHSIDRLYRPVTSLSFAVGRGLHGPAPLGPHAVNVALHAAVSALLLATLRGFFPGRVAAATIVALLFACHPALSEAVAGVVGRADLLAALFSLAAVGAAWRRANHWVPAILSALAFLSKESAIGLAAVVPLAAAFSSGNGRLDARRATRATLVLAVALGCAAAARVAVLSNEIPVPMPPGFAVENPLAIAATTTRILTAFHVLGRYAALLLFPIRLRSDASFDQIPLVTTPLDAGVLAGAALLIGLAALAAVGIARRSPLAIGALLAIFPLLVVSNAAFPIGTIYGERLLYVPAIGIAILGAAIASRGLSRAARPALAAIVVLLTIRTHLREAIYASESAFFRAMVADSPRSAKAWNVLAIHHSESGRLAEADAAADAALRIFPEYAEAHAQKGYVALRREDRASAERHFREAIRCQPGFGLARLELAQILKASGPPRLEEAATEFEAALALLPRRPEPAYGLGAVRFLQERGPEALAAYEEALRRRPGFGYAHYGRAIIRVVTRDFESAKADFLAAMAAAPELDPLIFDWLDLRGETDEGAKRLREDLARSRNR